MRRWIALTATMLCISAVLATTAVPASAAPGGNGLVEFGTPTCDGIGEVLLFGPRGPKADSGYLVIDENGEHVLATLLQVTFTDLDGNVSTVSQSYGQKVPFTTFTCTQEFEEPGGSGELTVKLAFVPAR